MNMVVWFSRIVEIAADRKKFTPKDNEMSNVILGVLEAAGRVDRQNAELVLCHITDIALGRHHKEWEVFYDQIRALIETLPERGKEEK